MRSVAKAYLPLDAELVVKALIVMLFYAATGWFGLKMPYAGTHITLFWLPTGIAVGALLRWGTPVWPGVYLGAFLVNMSIGSTLPLAAGIAVGNTFAPIFAAFWLRRVHFHSSFDRQKDVTLFVAAAAIGMSVSATGGVLNLFLAGLLPAEAVGSAWLSWWMGDTVGVLLAAPFLLTCSRKDFDRLKQYNKELLLWILCAAALAWLAFVHDYEQVGRPLSLAFMTLPVLAWASLRFGKPGAALAALGFSVVAAWSTATGHGSFQQFQGNAGLFLLWSYMGTTVLTGLLIISLQAERFRVESNLRESEEKLRGLYEMAPLGIALTDMQGRYIEFNEAFRQICAYPEAELKALDYWHLTPEKYKEDEAQQLASLESTGYYGPYEKEYVSKDGSAVPIRLNGMLIERNDGQKYIWSIVEDIAERKQIEADLRVAATAFDAQIGIFVTDANSVILRVNRAFTLETGYAAEDVVGKTPRIFKSGRHGPAFYETMWDSIIKNGSWQGEIWDRRKNGDVYPKWMAITAVMDDRGETTHYVSTQLDITERKAVEHEMKTLAFYDPLTHLPNRRLLLDRLRQALAAATRTRSHGALLFIDLDNFKILNDTLGHDKGDMLLQQVAQRLSRCVREGDTVARIGGDEFVIMLEDLSESTNEAAAQVEVVGEKILAGLDQTYSFGGQEYRGTTSIGVTLFGERHVDMGELMKQADLAMYQAKGAGRNALRFFDPAMQAAISARVGLEKDLRDALRDGHIVSYYQPQVDDGGRSTGAEVLVRWKHPERGMIFPNDFIPLAEDTGLILQLGHQVLASSCKQLVEWANRPQVGHLTLAVNVSVHQLRQPDFVERVLAILDRTGADPRKLKLELTESHLMDNVESTIAKMTALKARGVGFALDDFGTGYSSLAYLKRLPLERLKIDRSFVMDVLIDPNDAAIAKTIVALANSLGLAVIAEGVETEEQRNFLEENGCYAYQGYLFSKPLPLHEFESFLSAQSVQT